MPRLPEQALDAEQRRVARALLDGPRGVLQGPFVPLLRSPELFERVQELGAFLRYRSALGNTLSELVILLVARHWNQPVEWQIHAPIAVRAGVDPGIVAAIGRGEPPTGMDARTTALYRFVTQLQETQSVDDGVYAEALAMFGERGVVDLLGLAGYYTLLAMVMNGLQTAPESSGDPLLEALPLLPRN